MPPCPLAAYSTPRRGCRVAGCPAPRPSCSPPSVVLPPSGVSRRLVVMVRPPAHVARRQTKTPSAPNKGGRRACLRGTTSLAVTTRRQPLRVPTHPGSLTGAPGDPYSRGHGAFRIAAHEGASGRHQHRLTPAAGSLRSWRTLLSSLNAVLMLSRRARTRGGRIEPAHSISRGLRIVKLPAPRHQGHAMLTESQSTPVDFAAGGRVGASGGRPVRWTPGPVDARSGGRPVRGRPPRFQPPRPLAQRDL